MGTGKTVIGRRLANKLGFRFTDIDSLIEKREGQSIVEIFQNKGELYFRKLEGQIINEVAGIPQSVITTGGGAVIQSKNREVLQKKGWLVCLTATPEIIHERTRKRENRPLIHGGDPLKKIQNLMNERSKFYSEANLTIDTSPIKPDTVVLVERQASIIIMERILSGLFILPGLSIPIYRPLIPYPGESIEGGWQRWSNMG